LDWSKMLGPAYTVLRVRLEPGEELWSEPGAMMLFRGEVEVKTESGGIGRALLRKLAGGESFFFNVFRAESPAEVWLVPGIPGDIEAIELRGDEWVIQDTSYLAHYGDIEVSAGFRGLRGLIAAGEVFWLTPGWMRFKDLVFKDWDIGKINENFPKNDVAIVLDAIGYYDKLMEEDPMKILEYSDWMHLGVEAYHVTLDRFKGLLLDKLEALKKIQA